MSENYFQMVFQSNFKRKGKRIKQIREHVKVDNKLIETGDLDLFIFVIFFIHAPLPTQIHSLVSLAHGGHSICSLN